MMRDFFKFNLPQALLVLFTFIAGLAAVAAWLATRDLVAGAETTAERQLRAYVFITDAKMVSWQVGKSPQVKLTIRNTGQTPAYDVSVQGDFFSQAGTAPGTPGAPGGPAAPAAPPPLKPTDAPKTAIGPGGLLTPSTTRTAAVDAKENTLVRSGGAALMYYGVVKYRDAFGHARGTTFRYLFDAASAAGDGTLTVASEGNGAD
jgi:hypothetical protein